MSEENKINQAITNIQGRLDGIPTITLGNPLAEEALKEFAEHYRELKDLQLQYSQRDAWTQSPDVLMRDSGLISALISRIAEIANYYIGIASHIDDFRFVYEAFLRKRYLIETKDDKEGRPVKKYTDLQVKSFARERLAEFMERHAEKVVGAEAMARCLKSSELLCQRLKDCATMQVAMGDKGDAV